MDKPLYPMQAACLKRRLAGVRAVDYSYCKAVVGSTRDALRAGRYPDKHATPASATVADVIVTRSCGATP
jgi:hypothetical protein